MIGGELARAALLELHLGEIDLRPDVAASPWSGLTIFHVAVAPGSGGVTTPF